MYEKNWLFKLFYMFFLNFIVFSAILELNGSY